MLVEFATWWTGQMRDMLPAVLLRSGSQQDARIVAIDRLAGGDEKLTGSILLRRHGVETFVAALALDDAKPAPESGLPTVLRLPPDTMLCRDVTLPLAAGRDLQTVMGFEMDRLTPFTAAELFWGVGGLRPNRARARLNLNLFFVLRAPVDSACAALLRIGLKPSFLEGKTGPGGLHSIALEAAARPAIRWAQSSLPALCGVLALACLVSPILRQQIALDAAGASIAASTPAAQTAMALRRQLAIAASGQEAVAQARRNGDALQVLANLTAALPDGTWLSDMQLKSGDLTFDGRSSDAAALIGRLAAIPGLRDPSFTGPVTRVAGTDQFALHTSVQE